MKLKVKLMFSLSFVHMFSVLVCMCVFFKESNVLRRWQRLAKREEKRREEKRREEKRREEKLMFDLGACKSWQGEAHVYFVSGAYVLVCLCVCVMVMF